MSLFITTYGFIGTLGNSVGGTIGKLNPYSLFFKKDDFNLPEGNKESGLLNNSYDRVKGWFQEENQEPANPVTVNPPVVGGYFGIVMNKLRLYKSGLMNKIKPWIPLQTGEEDPSFLDSNQFLRMGEIEPMFLVPLQSAVPLPVGITDPNSDYVQLNE